MANRFWAAVGDGDVGGVEEVLEAEGVDVDALCEDEEFTLQFVREVRGGKQS